MKLTKTRGALILLGSALVAGALVLGAGCEKKTETSKDSPPPKTTRGEPDGTYSIRGIIERLPGGSIDLMIHHEAIEDFTDREGEVVGMNAMTMPFPELGSDVSLDGFGVGDKVAFTLEVWWTGRRGWEIASLEKLDAGTELDFGAPEADSDEADGHADAFVVRGVIVTLPEPSDAVRRLTVHHEAIDGFTNAAGEVVAMRSMTMGFEAGEDVSFESLTPGATVTMMVRAVWDGGRLRLVVTKITLLPQGTELDFQRLPDLGG